MRSPIVLLASVLLGMPQFVGTPVARAQSTVGRSGQQVQVSIPPAVGRHEAGPAADDAKALAEKLQNPIGDLISVPFQNNTNFNVGPHTGTQDILNIQPVIPIHLNQDWTLITRTIVPLVWSPSFQPAESVPFGLSATTVTAFLAPSRPVNGWLRGVGPIVQIPTITNKSLGSNVWGAGQPASWCTWPAPGSMACLSIMSSPSAAATARPGPAIT